MKKLLKIDSNGFFIEDVVISGKTPEGTDTPIPEDCIETPCPEGFYWPKWDGEKWIEGKTQTEINAIKNAPIPKTPFEELQEVVDELVLASLEV